MLQARDLVKAPAVQGVSFTVDAGETLAIVGGSGAGKSTVARLLAGLTRPASGEVLVSGADPRKRRKDLQMVFQDQSGSLDPMMRVRDIVAEPLVLHTDLDRSARRARVLELLARVGLRAEHAVRRPAELSGGQRQRVAIARAVACRPQFVICDEPLSSVDIKTQGQVLSLLASLRAETGFGCVFISHDLAAVRRVADRIAVMRAGRIVEIGRTPEIFEQPRHEYTRALIAAIPSVHARRLG